MCRLTGSSTTVVCRARRPHFLGGGVGLAASAHLLAAVGGDGLLEIDANDNPLRGAVTGERWRIEDGMVDISTAPGIGCAPDLDGLAGYETGRFEVCR